MSGERVERRLAAILAADVAGYSRLMGTDEEGTLRRLQDHRRAFIDPNIREHRGRIVKTTGDGMLVEFGSVVDAVRCAVEVQRGMIDRETQFHDPGRLLFRIGINLGDIIVEGDDIFGDGVNIAARLEALAEPGGICISGAVSDQIGDRLGIVFRDMGEHIVKNILRPVRTYALSLAEVAATPPVAMKVLGSRTARKRRRALLERGPRKPQPKASPRLSVLVLPFVNLAVDSEQDYFTDAITDDVISGLSRIEGCLVVSRSTAFTFKSRAVDAKQIGRDLGVRFVLGGSLRRLGAQLQLGVQLTDVESGAVVWVDRFDVGRDDPAMALDEIVTRLARSLHIKIVEIAARRIDQEGSPNSDAGDFAIRGWACLNRVRSVKALREGEVNFERALQLDPHSIDARIGLATVLTEFVGNANAGHMVDGVSIPRETDLARSEQLLTEVLTADAYNPKATYMLGRLRGLQNRYTDSRILLQAAIRADPNMINAYHLLGITLVRSGEPEEAVPHFAKKAELDPVSANMHVAYGWSGYANLLMGRADLAIELLYKARAAAPQIWAYHMFLAAALGFKGEIDEAKASLAEGLSIRSEVASLTSLRNDPFFKLGNRKYFDLWEKTVAVGLRGAGMSEE